LKALYNSPIFSRKFWNYCGFFFLKQILFVVVIVCSC
jgi:hypothetical protein